MHNNLFTIFGFTVHGYGLMIALGVIAASSLGMIRAKKKKMNTDVIIDIILIAVFSAFIGAKLLFIIIDFPEFLIDPMKVISGDGFVVYGGIILAVFNSYIYCKKKQIDFLDYFDLAAPSIALGQTFGRLGCFLAGCCYGRETTSAIGVVFPEGSLAPAGVKLIPTQLISSLGDFGIMVILLLYARSNPKKGRVAALYLYLYAIGRFIIEYFRNDYRGQIGFLSTSQLISVVIILLTSIWLYRQNTTEKFKS